MATARATAHTTAVSLFTAPRNKRVKLTSITVDNQGAAARTVRIQDLFTPDPSMGTPVPTLKTIERAQLTVGAGLTGSMSAEELKNVPILGEAKAISDAVDANCVIIVSYSME